MAAWTSEEEQRRRRRQRILRGLLLGGAAIGLPAVINATIARKARRIEPTVWGRRHRYAWDLADVTFQRLGAGDPVVLLHSFGPGHDSLEWRRVAERLSEKFQVFAPDFPGWGRSERPATPLDGELYIEFLLDFLDDVVRRRAVIVTSGLSAAYAVEVAVDHPELVRALVLTCPVGIDDASEEPDLKDAVIHRLLKLPVFGTSAMNLYTTRKGIQRYLAQEIYHGVDGVTDSLVDHHYRGAHEPANRAALAAYLAGYLNHRIAPALTRLHTPTLLVWGREAVSPPVESADLWLSSVRDAELEVLDGAGVLPHDEAAEVFSERISRFIAALPAG
ncbi:MAG: alpha/beta hydrolase [Thermoanaerobaculia bacterium]